MADATLESVTPARSLLTVTLVVLVALACRVPSLFDPPWLNDEGTYFAIAQAMSRGYSLYTQLWENKPPAIYLLYLAVYHLFGPSLLAVRLLAAAAAVAIMLLTFVLGRSWGSPRIGYFAALLAGLLLAVPVTEGTSANAEIFLATFSCGAVWLALVRERPELAAVMMIAAAAFKAVGVLDATALGIWLLAHHRQAARSYLVAYAMSAGAVLAVLAGLGLLGPFLRDALIYNIGYVVQGNTGHTWGLGLKLAALVLLTVVLIRRPFPFLWLVYALAGALTSGRLFGHYAIQFFVPLSLCVAYGLQRRHALSRRALAALPAFWLALAGLCAAVGWGLAATGHDSLLARRLQYYANFVRYALGTESRAVYRSQVDGNVTPNLRAVAILRHVPRGRLLVWGNAPWIYVLSHRLPATPYTSALRTPAVPGEQATLRDAVDDATPGAIVLIQPASPPLGALSRVISRSYWPVARTHADIIYVGRRPHAKSRNVIEGE